MKKKEDSFIQKLLDKMKSKKDSDEIKNILSEKYKINRN